MFVVKKISFLLLLFWLFSFSPALAMPASTNYKLKDYGFGTGGTANSSSSNYFLEAITGEVSGNQSAGTSYKVGPGLIFTGQANVPAVLTFDNPTSYYNKLRFVINDSGNPSDTKFAVAISDDNFVTTNYVQSDYTVGAVLGAEDYRIYADWGGGADEYVIGLIPGTTYKVKVKAMQGEFSETGYGPTATAATVNPTLSFDIDVSATDSETNPPFAIDLGDLTADTVVDSSEKVWVDFSTNGESGGRIYVIGGNEGLLSTAASYKIDAITADLGSLAQAQGFGAQGYSADESSGGPFTIASLYDKTDDLVGITDQYAREIFTSANPISDGRGSFLLKAKSSVVTPPAEDYSETLTVIASGSY